MNEVEPYQFPWWIFALCVVVALGIFWLLWRFSRSTHTLRWGDELWKRKKELTRKIKDDE